MNEISQHSQDLIKYVIEILASKLGLTIRVSDETEIADHFHTICANIKAFTSTGIVCGVAQMLINITPANRINVLFPKKKGIFDYCDTSIACFKVLRNINHSDFLAKQ